ncbi:MAG: zinc-ribbon domain-containing protein, partial [Clostridia bacterium]|nr:zinc-ribbon domain-containing protein [Clostridia bacterium]
MTKKKCPSCGKKVAVGAVYCIYCSYRFPETDLVEESQDPDDSPVAETLPNLPEEAVIIKTAAAEEM